jgi:glycosyltransferase involved in cell wall biosynthesis
MKHKLLFDLSATQPQSSRYHGGGEYAKILFERIVGSIDDAADMQCCYDAGRELDGTIAGLARQNGINLVPYKAVSELAKIAGDLKINRIYSALPYAYGNLRFEDIEFICTIHGLRAIEMPTDKCEIKYRQRPRDIIRYIVKQVFRESYLHIRKSQIRKLLFVSNKLKVIVPSLHTKFALRNHFPEFDQEQVYVLYSPRQTSTQPAGKSVLNRFEVQEKGFYLVVSTDRWTKNSYRALVALDTVFSKHTDINKKVLCLGIPEGGLREKFRGYVANKEKFVFSDYVDRATLELLYKTAFCFIYSTLNEGFGYPALECMKYGTPVIGSAITSVPEICQDGILYFNPFLIEEMKNRILQMTYEDMTYKQYCSRGPEVFQNVSSKQDRMLDELVRMILY